MNSFFKASAIAVFVMAGGLLSICKGQSPLFIPDTLSGTEFNLQAQTGQTSFFPGKVTNTFGYNGSLLGPTLIINKGDSITLNVVNKLTAPTTVHWHGFHVAPEHDGGPHQIIAPNATWSPRFKMLNEASTFWYHPHGEGKTEIQISKGLAGMIIVRDQVEGALQLPRKYGVDDFPLIIQSKAFDVFYGIATSTHDDSVMMVNGTINPFLEVPKQLVRLRLLNASADRSYELGLSDNSDFYIIGSDGGLLSAPVTKKRVRISTGERVEILVDFAKYNVGDFILFKSYSSELPTGIIGADSVGTAEIPMGEDYYGNPLNGADFEILKFKIKATTSNPILSVPAQLVSRNQITTPVDHNRIFEFIPDTVLSGQEGYVDGPFYINGKPFHMDSINHTTYLNSTEIWTLVNKTLVAHPFHIHDVEFFVLDINGNEPPAELKGLKDVILVKPNDTVRFITRFEDFANDMVPYMFHCHLLHHEDEGMMGTFLVLDSSSTGINKTNLQNTSFKIYPVPASYQITIESDIIQSDAVLINSIGIVVKHIYLTKGKTLVDVSDLSAGMYVLKTTTANSRILISR